MQVRIEYCEACGYRRMAEKLAQAMQVAHAVPVELVPGGDGAFEVTADGRTIFSKQATGRFPTERELIETFRN